MREIVTLQFGQQANYLGTHYWNTQVGNTIWAYVRRLFVHIPPNYCHVTTRNPTSLTPARTSLL